MDNTAKVLASKDDPLEAAIADYFGRLDRGENIVLDELIDAHPGCEAGLRQFLQKEGRLQELAAGSLANHTLVGQIVGDFRLIRELGRGGMGIVYEAEQLSLGRRVALKVLPFAAMLDKQQLARFKNEARAAATLDHPHIVAIHSVGFEDGVHFYAMNLIDGQSLAQVIAALRQESGKVPNAATAVCENVSTDDQVLSTALNGADKQPRPAEFERAATPGKARQRLSLPEFATREYFRTVARLGHEAASALDYAHQSGVLHRDIKPANLLLDDVGKLWIADFGLARLETDASLTMTGDLLGTLRYMAPEQAQAQRTVTDHRCDIYSLGATLYELLTLEPTFGETDRAILLQQIARDEPPAPRKLNAHIPRDLETIVLKAMRKSAPERYATAQALADDLQNFLEDKPINAKPPTRRERLVKWSRRHPAVVLSTMLVLVATTIAAAASAVVVARAYHRESVQRGIAEKETQRAESERVRAEKNFMRAREAVRDIIVNGARGEGAWSKLSPELRTLFSDRAVAFYESLLQEESSDPSLQHETAVGYQSLAALHFSRLEFQQAEKLLRQSLTILDRLCLEHPEAFEYRRSRAWANRMLGATLFRSGQLVEADTAFETAIVLYKQLIEEEPERTSYLPELEQCLAQLKEIRDRRSGNEWIDEKIAIYQDAIRRAPENASAHYSLGSMLQQKGSLDDAIFSLREAVRLDPEQPLFHQGLALALHEKGLLDEAIAVYRNALRLDPNTYVIHTILGTALVDKGLLDEGIVEHREAIRLGPTEYLSYQNLSVALNKKGMLDEAIAEIREAIRLKPDAYLLEVVLGGVLARRGQYADAISAIRKALRHDPNDLHAHYVLARTLNEMGLAEESADEYQTAIEGYRKQIDLHPDNAIDLYYLARALADFPNLELREREEAVTLASRAVELKPSSQHFWQVLGKAHYRTGEYSDASEALRQAHDLGNDDATTLFFLAMAEWQLGNTDSAREWYDKALQWLEQRPQIVGGEIVLLRSEAEQLLGISETAGHTDSSPTGS